MADNFNHRLASLELAKTNTSGATALSNSTDVNVTNSFWKVAYTDELRWDQAFPFQLMVVEHKGGGVYEEFQGAAFTLPVPPQAMQESMPFAISLDLTAGGVNEDHNGIPVRDITLRGTTGVLPGRPNGEALQSLNFAQSVFAGTINNVSTTIQSASSSLLTGSLRANQIKDEDIAGDLKGTTGYLQFLMLRVFLENYAFMKKNGGETANRLRLAFCNWKNEDIYLITPTVFVVDRTAGSPLEYPFTFSFRAWRRINLAASGGLSEPLRVLVKDKFKLQNMLAALSQARVVLNGAKTVLTSLGQDFDNLVFTPLREASLLAKDALGVQLTLGDIPLSIIRDARAAIDEFLSVPDAATRIDQQFQQQVAEMQQQALINEGSASQRRDAQDTDRLYNDYPDLFNNLRVGDLKLPSPLYGKIAKERDRIRNLSRPDWEQRRDGIKETLVALESLLGVGPSTSTVKARRQAQPSDFEAIFALNTMLMEFNRLCVSGAVGTKNKTNVFDYMQSLGQRSGISLPVPRSSFTIPFPLGITLERLAAKYLGSPDRWQEIAILNRLREPYVDEVGFVLPLLVNGNGAQVVVGDASSLYIGQAVWISSTMVTRTRRHIIGLEMVSPGQVRLTLDGDADMGSFKTSASAQLQAFLPGTINSQQLISIPSDQPAPSVDNQLRPLVGVDLFDTYLKLGGVDLMIAPNGDAAIGPDGDWKLAVGLQNIAQRLRSFVKTRRGSLLRHPGYGLNIEVGQSIADMSASQLLKQMQDVLVFDSDIFSRVVACQVDQNGGAVTISAGLELKGTSNLLPISFDVI